MIYPTLAHFRHFSHFRHSFNYNIFPNTLYNAKQTQFQNESNERKLYDNNEIQKYGQLVIQTNKAKTNPIKAKTNPIKAKTNPIQTQLLKRPKLMQSVYLQRIMKKNAAMGYKKTNPIQTQSQKILELTFGFNTIHCGQNYEKIPNFENKLFLTKG